MEHTYKIFGTEDVLVAGNPTKFTVTLYVTAFSIDQALVEAKLYSKKVELQNFSITEIKQI